MGTTDNKRIWFNGTAEVIAAATAGSIVLSIVFQISYLFGRGWPQAISHLTLADYIDGSVIAIAAVLLFLFVIFTGGVVAAFSPIGLLTKLYWPNVIVSILAIIFSFYTFYRAFRAGFLQHLDLVLGGAVIIVVSLLSLTFGHWRRSTLVKVQGKSDAEAWQELRRFFLVAFAPVLLVATVQVGLMAGAARKNCPIGVVIYDKDNNSLEGELVSQLQRELLITPANKSGSLFGIPWDAVSYYGVRDCMAPKTLINLKPTASKKTFDKSKVQPSIPQAQTH